MRSYRNLTQELATTRHIHVCQFSVIIQFYYNGDFYSRISVD